MGNIFCCNKKEKENLNMNSQLLDSHKFCNNCNQNFLFNEYFKHLPECNRKSRERYSLNL